MTLTDIDWNATCTCGYDRYEHFRLSPHGYMKPVPTPDGVCHGVHFTSRPS